MKRLLTAVGVSLAMASPVLAQGVVTITVPASIAFTVSNVTVNTNATPAAVTVSFSNLAVLPSQTLRISVMADAATFTSPSPGPGIPVTRLSWTTANASGGIGSSGTLSSITWTQVFQSASLTLSGSVDMAWVLAAPGGGIRSGNHTLVVRYRLEAV